MVRKGFGGDFLLIYSLCICDKNAYYPVAQALQSLNLQNLHWTWTLIEGKEIHPLESFKSFLMSWETCGVGANRTSLYNACCDSALQNRTQMFLKVEKTFIAIQKSAWIHVG